MRGLGNHVKIANCMFLFLMGSNFFEGVLLELVHFSCLLLSPIRKNTVALGFNVDTYRYRSRGKLALYKFILAHMTLFIETLS